MPTENTARPAVLRVSNHLRQSHSFIMRSFVCRCGNPLFFENTKCLQCQTPAGYDPVKQAMVSVVPGGPVQYCANGLTYSLCNWVVPAAAPAPSLCPSCALNRTIPDLAQARNRGLWASTEAAKRRLLYTLSRLGLQPGSKQADPRDGLAFDLVSTITSPGVTMGHLNGVITVNLEEADDTYRQINRQQLGESSRTLLGHFRHEFGHFIWSQRLSRLDWGHPQRIAFRELFGNEWLDYASALTSYYQKPLKPGWEQNYISAYSSAHPWEDWAETWAHYLQIVDALETFEAQGLTVDRVVMPWVRVPDEAGTLPASLPQSPSGDSEFLGWLERWVRLSIVLNEVSASIGAPSLYPFTISAGVAKKLRLVHHLVGAWKSKSD